MTVIARAKRGNERTVSSPELKSLVKLVAERLESNEGAPVYLLNALIAAIKSATAPPLDEAYIESPPPEWHPKASQIWTPKLRDKNGQRVTAWELFEKAYASIPFGKRPYAHQVRQHPKTKQLYNALCVIVSRNKSRGGSGPTSIAELFPTTSLARGGVLSDSRRR